MTAQPLWRSSRPGSWRVEVGVRIGELEVEVTAPEPFTQTVVVISRRDVADLADALYRWLREEPPGRGGIIVDPREYSDLRRALNVAAREPCARARCQHPMSVHGIGSHPERPTPCTSCTCPAFR